MVQVIEKSLHPIIEKLHKWYSVLGTKFESSKLERKLNRDNHITTVYNTANY